jgi:hypothetical protein
MSNSDERREQGRSSKETKNEEQLLGLLKSVKDDYSRETIEVALSKLPGAPLREPSTDIEEVREILNTYIKVFGRAVFWESIRKIGLKPRKDTETLHK